MVSDYGAQIQVLFLEMLRKGMFFQKNPGLLRFFYHERVIAPVLNFVAY